MNKELLNICYKFFNRFITSNELIKQLNEINTNKEINNLIIEINKIICNTTNEVDEYVIKKKESIKNLIDKLEQIPKDDENMKFITNQLDSLKKDYAKEIDSHERWFQITDCIDQNEYFNKCFESMSDYELLNFITQDIKAPFPPQIEQKQFDRLVKVGIEKDEREALWRLAFNYEERDINFDDIVNYFIKVKDGYYIAELISAVGECLDIDGIIDNINDKELIENLKTRKEVMSSYVTEEQFNKLINK